MSLFKLISILDVAMPPEQPASDTITKTLIYVIPVVVIAIAAAIIIKTKKANSSKNITDNKNE